MVEVEGKQEIQRTMNQNVYEDSVSDEEDDFKSATASVAAPEKRVIILLDVDCFEVQLWMKLLRPDLIGQDVPVVVINPDRIILSVNYTAKSLGVKRGEGRRALTDAHSQCNQAGRELVEIVAEQRFGKVNSFRSQTESNWILDTLLSCPALANSRQCIKVERTCKDEFYIDVTQFIDHKINYTNNCPCSHGSPAQVATSFLAQLKPHPNVKYDGKPVIVLEGRKGKITCRELIYRIQNVYPLNSGNSAVYHRDELRLIHGAILANKIIDHIKSQTGYDVSAGVGHLKLVAKLACGRNKPKGVNVITEVSLPRLSKSIYFQDLPGYAGKTGQSIRDLLLTVQRKDVDSIHDLLQSTNSGLDLVAVFKKLKLPDPVTTSLDLYNKCHFKDESLVTTNLYSAIFSTALSFKGMAGRQDLFENGVMNLSMDMANRINYYKGRGRHATELSVKADMIQNARVSPRDHCKRSVLSVEFEVHPDFACNIIWNYINQNNLQCSEITKIHLTASAIIVSRN